MRDMGDAQETFIWRCHPAWSSYMCSSGKNGNSVGWTGKKEQRARTSSDVLTFKVQEEKAQWPVAWEETQEQREELCERGNTNPSHRPLGGPSESQGSCSIERERSKTAPSKPLSPQGWGRAGSWLPCPFLTFHSLRGHW